MLGSDLGCSSGLRLRSGLLIPLNPGPILAYTRNFPNQPPLEDTLGLLDPGAAARASITLPPLSDPSLIGLRFHFAYVTAGGSALFPLTGASNAAVLELVP